jgi:hypothetical protein
VVFRSILIHFVRPKSPSLACNAAAHFSTYPSPPTHSPPPTDQLASHPPPQTHTHTQRNRVGRALDLFLTVRPSLPIHFQWQSGAARFSFLIVIALFVFIERFCSFLFFIPGHPLPVPFLSLALSLSLSLSLILQFTNFIQPCLLPLFRFLRSTFVPFGRLSSFHATQPFIQPSA